MGRKNKNVLGGAASGAAAGTSVMPGWGTAIGAVAGGVLGSMGDDEVKQLAPAIPADVVAKLYQQAIGNQQTVGELKGAQMYDKNLAQQIAAAKAQRGVNPGLLSRNVGRIAAEQSQANAQSAAILAADERNQAMAKYMQAQQMNAGIAAQNMGFERSADQQANNMLGAGLNSLGSSFALQAQKRDAAGESAKAVQSSQMQDAVDNSAKFNPSFGSSMANPVTGSNDSYGMSAQLNPVQNLNSQYTMGANQEINPGYSDYSMMSRSDKNSKTKIKSESLKMVSDERQKDLIKSENLPANNNLQMQNQSAQQPQSMQSMQAPQPAQATPQASAPQAATPVPQQAPAPGITAAMLQQAQQSSKGGGNIADIQNSKNQMQRGAAGIDAENLSNLWNQSRADKDFLGFETKSRGTDYRDRQANYMGQQQLLNDAYDKNQGTIDEQNLGKDAQRTARLNRFYTGIDTGSTNAVASQFAPKGLDYAKIQEAQQLSMYQNAMRSLSDENQKTDVKSENKGSADFNPKSFLDKLEAYSYEYKQGAKSNPQAGEGRHLSVMAQDLEKAGPVGQSMVEQDPQGNKVVDYAKGFGAILASAAQLNERLSAIEKRYGKQKKES